MGKSVQAVSNGKVVLIVAVVISLLMGIGNFVLVRHIAKREIPVCVVDVWKVGMEKSMSLSFDSSKDQKASQEELDRFIKRANEKMAEPANYGCSMIAVKGSILGNPRDITEVLLKELK